jgi:signal transduction histidine kinase
VIVVGDDDERMLPRKTNTLRTILRRSIFVQTGALLLITALGLSVFLLQQRLWDRARSDERTLLQIQELRSEVLAAQSSLRGFQQVEQDRFLQSYRTALPKIEHQLGELRVTLEPSERARLDEVESVFEAWLERFAEPALDAQRAGRDQELRALVRSGAGKRRIDTIKALLTEMSRQEREEVAEFTETENLLGLLAVLAVAAGCLVVGLVGVLLLRRINSRVTYPIEQLARAARRLGEGDLGVRVERQGVEEVSVVAGSFNRMAAEVEALVEGLRELDAMKSKFVSSVSHELRTPLTSVKGYVEMLAAQEVGPLSDEQEEYATIALRNVARLQRLIDDLLTLSRLDAGRLELELEPLDVGDVLGDVREAMEPLAGERDIRIGLEATPSLTVPGDRARLEQALGNLVSNAVKFSAVGETVLLRALREDGQALVEVCDSGVGIPEDELPELTERFYRASTAGTVEGTGLGLAIAREIIERHQGRVEVESEEGLGSTFRVRLPLQDGAVAGAPSESRQPGLRDHGYESG